MVGDETAPVTTTRAGRWSVWHSQVRAACEPSPLAQGVRGKEGAGV
jgi:hypothetical protein